jgi:hypothetical protein
MSRKQNDRLDGPIPPQQLVGRGLPGRFIVIAYLSFDERAARASEHLKRPRFTFEEHERLRKVLVKVITAGIL